MDLRLGGDRVEDLGQERECLGAKGGGRGEIEWFAAVATEMSRARRRSTHSAFSGGVVSPNWAHWSVARTPLPPAERDDGHAPPGWWPVPVADQEERDVNELLNRVHADDVQLAQDGVDHAVLADERAGVRHAPPGHSRSSRPP